MQDAMTPRELRATLHVSETTYYHYKALGAYASLEVVPRIGRVRYSRKAVQAYLDREPPRALRLAASR